MARPGKLTDSQWTELERRRLKGEKITDLAKAFGVSKSTVSERVSKHSPKIETLADSMFEDELQFRAMSVSEQRLVSVRIEDKRAMHEVKSDTALLSARGENKLHRMVQKQLDIMDEDNPNLENLTKVAALTKTANDLGTASDRHLAQNKPKDAGGVDWENLVTGGDK